MRVGMFLLVAGWPGRDHATTLRAAVDAAVAAEDAGFDDVWVAEHHFMTYGLCPSAITLASHLLGVTRRITVGTAVSVLPTAHPVALAEQSLMLDQVSGGRFRLGLGRGGPWVDLEVFGTGASRHTDPGYATALDLLLDTLRGPSVAASSADFAFRPVAVTPAPRAGVAYGGVAPVLAATSESGIHAAASRGLPMLLGMHADDEEKARFVARWAQWVAPGPRPGLAPARGAAIAVRSRRPAGHVSVGIAHIEDSTGSARATVRRSLPRWLEPGLAGYVRLDRAPRTPRDAAEYTDLLCDLHPVGDADHAVARLTASATATGIDHVVLLTDTTGDPSRTRENIARLGAEVLPRLPGRVSGAGRPRARPPAGGPRRRRSSSTNHLTR